MLTYDQFQKEHLEWSAHNWREQPPWVPLLGIVEEVGELASSRVTDGGVASAADAVGDILVYLAHYCNDMDVSMQEAWDSRKAKNKMLRVGAFPKIVAQLGRLAHAHIKQYQGIRTNEDHDATRLAAVGDLMRFLDIYCSIHYMNMQQCMEETWTKVKQRDWVANPVDGSAPVE